jgi:1,2-diacylglycerol 3-alpha-glucosyltransferase
MKIAMFTNTYLPHVGGVTRSVQTFAEEFRRQGHRVLIVAPEFEGMDESEEQVVRVPAIQHFNGTDFSVPMPVPGLVASTMRKFQPQIVHAHHPFLMGSTAMRVARSRGLPLVFTHHTMWDQYTHYASAESPVASKFTASLATGYANFCSAVIAPSQSIADLLRERGVESRIEVIPTGVDADHYAHGDGAAFRRARGIAAEAIVAGYVGRLAPEKNLGFLAQAAARFAADEPRARLLVVGGGGAEEDIRRAFADAKLDDRLIMAGVCAGQELIDAYHAMDFFIFASQTETQGMVLTEAMAASRPAVALDGPGVRDVVRDRINGRLVAEQDIDQFATALAWMAARTPEQASRLRAAARATAERLSMPRTARLTLRLYESLLAATRRRKSPSPWTRARRRLAAEWDLLSNVAHAASEALEPAAPAAAR